MAKGGRARYRGGFRAPARSELIERWDRDRQASPSDTQIILTHTNDEVRELNDAARGKLRASGELGNDVTVRAERVAMVRDYLATVTADELASTRRNPWAPDRLETVRDCLHVILEEEWEHQRYAVRDLDAIADQRPPGR